MKVSVIIAAYNRPAMLREAVHSVLASENRAASLADIIIVDDASTDPRVRETTDALCAAHPGLVRAHRLPVNGGQSRARNAGIEMAAGELILALDDDDLVAPHYLPAAAALMQKRPDAGIVYANGKFFGAKEGDYAPPPPAMPDFLVRNVIPGCAVFRKDDWNAVEGYDEALRFWEGWDLWLKIIGMGRGALRLRATGFSWRRHPEGTPRAGDDVEEADLLAAYARIIANNPALYARVFPDTDAAALPPLLLQRRAALREGTARKPN